LPNFYVKPYIDFGWKASFLQKKFLSIILIQRLIICINNPVPGNHSQRFFSAGLDIGTFYQKIGFLFIA